MSRRIEALEEEVTTTGAGSPRSAQSQKKVTVKLASNLFLNLPEGLSELSYSKIGKTRMIACFMIDGSDRYTAMTINAINSFLKATPEMHAGVLVPPSWGLSIFATRVVPQLVAPERVIFKKWGQHFAQWNPTQYKLDILQFADEYDVVLWLDSDTIVYDDLRPLLFAFYKSPAKYMFVRDHVCYLPEFLNNYPFKDSKGGAFVPQACFMGFKAEHMKRLFTVWEDTWRQWIEPEPFKNFADPLPSFPGSKFCIEQYALGHALVLAEIGEEDILEIARSHIVLNTRNLGPSGRASSSGSHGDYAGHGAGGGVGYGGAAATRQPGVSELSGSTANAGLPSSQFLATSAFLAFASASSSYGSSHLSSYLTSYLTSYPSSYWSSYSSYGVVSGGTITYFGASTATSAELDAGQSGAPGFAPGVAGHEGRHYPDLPEHIAMDNLGGCVVHFYNSFYDAAHYWWTENEPFIVKALKP
jgi:hypothetical protein